MFFNIISKCREAKSKEPRELSKAHLMKVIEQTVKSVKASDVLLFATSISFF